MLELNIAKNNNQYNPGYGLYYARVEYKKTLGIHDMALHMADHHSPFSAGTIEGILRDFVKCTREQPEWQQCEDRRPCHLQVLHQCQRYVACCKLQGRGRSR